MIADINLEAAELAAAACRAGATSADAGLRPGFKAEAVHVDVTVETSIQRLVFRMVETFGRIDYCVNSAGVRNFSAPN